MKRDKWLSGELDPFQFRFWSCCPLARTYNTFWLYISGLHSS